MKEQEKQIEEMAKADKDLMQLCKLLFENWDGTVLTVAKTVLEHYQPKLPKDSVVLSREEYEKIKSLYDTQNGAIMTSSIGDLPLTVESLRKAVDEITRLINVQTELQELNAKYYNEAKDLSRELNQARKETAEKFANEVYKDLYQLGRIYALPETFDADKYGIFSITQEVVAKIAKEQFDV